MRRSLDNLHLTVYVVTFEATVFTFHIFSLLHVYATAVLGSQHEDGEFVAAAKTAA